MSVTECPLLNLKTLGRDSNMESYIYLKEYPMDLDGGDSSVDSYILGNTRLIGRECTIVSKANQDRY